MAVVSKTTTSRPGQRYESGIRMRQAIKKRAGAAASDDDNLGPRRCRRVAR